MRRASWGAYRRAGHCPAAPCRERRRPCRSPAESRSGSRPVVCELGGTRDRPVALHGGEHGRGDQIGDVRGENQQSPSVAEGFDPSAADHRGDRQARAQRLGQSQQVPATPLRANAYIDPVQPIPVSPRRRSSACLGQCNLLQPTQAARRAHELGVHEAALTACRRPTARRSGPIGHVDVGCGGCHTPVLLIRLCP